MKQHIYPPQLSAEEERLCIQRWFEEKDQKARERLITNMMRYITLCATRYARTGTSFDDLVQVGVLGVMHALEKFDPSRGLRFVTYAAPWIKQQMRMLIGSERSLLSGTTLSQKRKDRELDEQRRLVHTEEFHDLGGEDDTNDGYSRRASASLERTDDDDIDYMRREERFRELVEKADLDSNERMLIEKRWLSPFGVRNNMIPIAKEMGLTRQRLEQIEGSAIEKMREIAHILCGDDL